MSTPSVYANVLIRVRVRDRVHAYVTVSVHLSAVLLPTFKTPVFSKKCIKFLEVRYLMLYVTVHYRCE
jgi:hypothetical protein